MTTLALSRRAFQAKTAIVSIVFNWRLFSVLGVLFFMLMLGGYIFLVNNLTQGTYVIKNFQKEISALSRENVALETDFAQTNFLESVTHRARELGFEKTGKVSYIQISDNSLAAK